MQFQPKNTQESTKWAVKNYNEWSKARNAMYTENPEEQVPEVLLQSTDPTILSKWLGLFIAETRKQDGGLYPPKTLCLLLSGVYRYMKSLNSYCPNIMDASNKDFILLHTAIDKGL